MRVVRLVMLTADDIGYSISEPAPILNTVHVFIHLIFTVTLSGGYYLNTHFPDGEIEAPRGYLICTGSPSQ